MLFPLLFYTWLPTCQIFTAAEKHHQGESDIYGEFLGCPSDAIPSFSTFSKSHQEKAHLDYFL